jgi:hypothetical protein
MTCLASSQQCRVRQQPVDTGITFVSHNRFEAAVAARAVSYTTICFMGRGKYDRRDYGTLAEALAGAPAHRADQGRGVLVYAIDDRSFTALVATLPRPTKSRGVDQR